MQVGSFLPPPAVNAGHPSGGKDGEEGHPISFPICSHPGTEEPCLLAEREQQQKGVSTNPLQLPTGETARPQALLSLVQQQDELQGGGCLQGPEALLGEMVFTPWDRKL